MATTKQARFRSALFVAGVAAMLCAPAAERRPFTGVYATATGASVRGSGWNFAPVPGVRIGVDGEAIRTPFAGLGNLVRERRDLSLDVSARVGAVIGRSTLVYVRAGYAHRRKRERGLLLGAGVEHIAENGATRRNEIRLTTARSAEGDHFVSTTSYRI